MILQGSCEETAELMSEHLEDTLRGLPRWRVLRHLARCVHCPEVLRSLRATIDVLQRIGRHQAAADPSIADAIVERLRREGDL